MIYVVARTRGEGARYLSGLSEARRAEHEYSHRIITNPGDLRGVLIRPNDEVIWTPDAFAASAARDLDDAIMMARLGAAAEARTGRTGEPDMGYPRGGGRYPKGSDWDPALDGWAAAIRDDAVSMAAEKELQEQIQSLWHSDGPGSGKPKVDFPHDGITNIVMRKSSGTMWPIEFVGRGRSWKRDALTDEWTCVMSDEVRTAAIDAPAVRGTMEPAGESRTETGTEAPDMTTMTIDTMKRRTGATGAHGVFAQQALTDGTLKRALLAGEFFGYSTLNPGAKGARWVIGSYGDATGSAAAFTGYFAGDATEVRAIVCELTQGDIDRIRRGVIPSLIYPALGNLEEDEATS